MQKLIEKYERERNELLSELEQAVIVNDLLRVASLTIKVQMMNSFLNDMTEVSN